MKSAVFLFSVILVVSYSHALMPIKIDGPPADPTEVKPSKSIAFPPQRCGMLCKRYCPNGFVTNSQGCPICRCKPGKCPRFLSLFSCRSCKSGRAFYTDNNGCRRCRCRTKPVCPVYKKDPCDGKECPNGFLKNSRGCPTCKCKGLINICPIKLCSTQCKNGFRVDSQGCNTCTCNPTGGKSCRSGGKTYPHGRSYKKGCNTCFCRNGRSICTRKRCNNDCPKLKCKPCLLGRYERDSKGCQTCRCRFPNFPKFPRLVAN